MRKLLLGITALIALSSYPAWADSIVFVGPYVITGNGFGNNPRALTLQSHGPNNSTESGCIAPGLISGGAACAAGDGAVGGDETNPIGFPKQAAPSLSSLGITNGNQIGILFDAVQPQNNVNDIVDINDLTLKLYSSTGTLLYDVSGIFSSLTTNPGNGSSDYLFTLDPSAVTDFNAALAGNTSDDIALDSTISFPNGSGGPESYTLIALPATVTPTPEPSTLVLLGTSLLGLAALAFRKKDFFKSSL